MPEKGAASIPRLRPGRARCGYDQAAYAPNREQLIERRIRDSEWRDAVSASPSASRMDRRNREARHLPRQRRGADLRLHPRRRLAQRPLQGLRGSGRDVPRRRRALRRARLRLGAGVGGSLMVLADQVCRAVAWVYENAARFGGDPNRLYVVGIPQADTSPRSR